MHYLYKLKFSTPVHFGAEKVGIGLEKTLPCGTAYADTLFSALFMEALALGLETDFLLKNLKLTDLLPYDSKDYYLPKPLVQPNKNKKEDDSKSSKNKKKAKKLKFVPVSQFESYLQGKFLEDKDYDSYGQFGQEGLTHKVALPRIDEGKENDLYSVGSFSFAENCGLYFITEMTETDKISFDKLMKSLQLSGLGGKRTSGYGQFECIEVKDFPIELKNGLNLQGDKKMLLSCCLPNETEIDAVKKGSYTLIARNGFAYSTKYPLTKRQNVTMLKAGSVFKQNLEGQIANVAPNNQHPVYRYGKTLSFSFNFEEET